jgi:hypothetical protein
MRKKVLFTVLSVAEDVFEDKEGVFFCTVDSEWGF